MRFGTSFFDWPVFKKTVTRYWPVWGAYFVLWLIMLPLNGLMMLRLDSYGRDFSYMEEFAIGTVPATVESYGLALAVVFGALCAMAVFSHLYSPRSANFFGGLPVRREALFLTHYLAGLAFLVVPNAVIFLLTLLVEAAGGAVCWPALGFWLAALCGGCFFFYSLAVFCAMFTGSILVLPVFYAIVNVLAVGIYGLLEMVFQGFYYGFAGFPEGVMRLVTWLTPAAQLEEAVAVQSTSILPGELAQIGGTGGIWVSDTRYLVLRGLGTVGVYAVVALALTAGAFFLYRARRLESAGDVVSVKAMRPVFLYGMAFCMGLALGIGTVLFTGGEEIGLMIAILFWGVAGYFIARMMLEKSFRVFGKWKGAVAVAAVFVVLFCVVGFDLTGFETRVPAPGTVDSVYVFGVDPVYLGDDGDSLSLDITDPGTVELLTILHKEAVAQRDWDWRSQEARVTAGLNLDYRLKGGGTLSRRYTLWLDPDEAGTEGTAAWAVQRLYDDRELYWEAYGFKALEDSGRLDRVDVSHYDEVTGEERDGTLYAADARTLLAAVKEDFFAGRIGVRRVDDDERWHGGPVEDSLNFFSGAVPLDNGFNTSYNVQIALQDTATSTLAALDALADELAEDGSWTDGYDGYPDTQAG